MKKYGFLYAFQLSKKIIFEVHYYTLGSNEEDTYFSTSAVEFNQPKTDYTIYEEANLSGQALEFYNKWNYLHHKNPNNQEYMQILEDIEDLKQRYNYLEIIDKEGFRGKIPIIEFNRIKELSVRKPKKG